MLWCVKNANTVNCRYVEKQLKQNKVWFIEFYCNGSHKLF